MSIRNKTRRGEVELKLITESMLRSDLRMASVEVKLGLVTYDIRLLTITKRQESRQSK